jgi:hypothetical protein
VHHQWCFPKFTETVGDSASRPYRALIGLVLNADVLLAGQRFGGQSAGVAGGDAVGVRSVVDI